MSDTPTKCLWEILVPSERPPHHREKHKRIHFGKRYHQVWDKKVRSITGGLTVMKTAKGQWVAPDGELFAEPMIPVRIVATDEQMSEIIDFTMTYYDQLAIMCYELSSNVIIRHREEQENAS